MATNTLTLDEINLIKNSEEVKDTKLYGNLFEIISTQNFNKGSQIEAIKGLNRKAQNILHYNKQLMMKNVISEWYAEKTIETDEQQKIHCSLCNTKNKYLFFIKNRKNGKILNVGSSCITKFPGIEGYEEQKIALKNIQKNKLIAQRIIKFNSYFPDILVYINNIEAEFENLDILIPKDKYMLVKRLILELRNIYTEYTQTGKSKTYLNPINIFSLKLNALNNAMFFAHTYVDEHKNKHLICKKREVQWLIKHNRTPLLLKIAENNGYYTHSTLKLIHNPAFIKENLHIFLKKNMSESLNIIKYNENKNEIVLATEIIYNPPVILSIDGNLFMQEIGANCLTDSKYTYNTDQLITIAKIRSTQNNIYTISISTNAFVDKYGCVFLDDETRDYFYLYRRKDGAIRAINKNKFLEAYTPYLCKSLDSIEQYFKKFIYSKNARWIYKEQQDKNGILDYIQKLYKEYKKTSSV